MNPNNRLKFLVILVGMFLLAAGATGCLPVLQREAPPGNASLTTAQPAEISPPASESGEKNSSSTGPGEILGVEVGVEPSPFPERQVYTNSEYGLQFDYPVTWTISEADHGVLVRKGARQLTIRYRWDTELAPPGFNRSGLPAGDLLYRDKVVVFGEVFPVEFLVYEDRVKMVLYNEGDVMESERLQLRVVLEDLNTAYEGIDISPETIQEANRILESLRRTPVASTPPARAEGYCAGEVDSPPGGWKKYRNEDYGFYFSYPEAVQVIEMGHLIMVRDGDLTMQIKYRGADEPIPMTGPIPEGDVELIRFENYFGDDSPNPIVVERSDGAIDRVSIGNLMTDNTPVQFLVAITDPSGEGINLDRAEDLLEIIDYLCITP